MWLIKILLHVFQFVYMLVVSLIHPILLFYWRGCGQGMPLQSVVKAPVYQIWGICGVLCGAAKRVSLFYSPLTVRNVLSYRITCALGLLFWHIYLNTAVCH